VHVKVGLAWVRGGGAGLRERKVEGNLFIGQTEVQETLAFINSAHHASVLMHRYLGQTNPRGFSIY